MPQMLQAARTARWIKVLVLLWTLALEPTPETMDAAHRVTGRHAHHHTH